MLLCINPILTYFPINFGSRKAPDNSIKILSYNVRGFNRDLDKPWGEDHQMVQYLSSVDADIICMQEYMASTSDKHASSKNLQKLLKKYPYYSVIPLRSTRGGYEYGLACFSKYPITESSRMYLPRTDNGIALYKIDVDGKTLDVVNVHLESNRLTSEDKKLYRDFLKESAETAPSINQITQNIEDKLGTAYRRRAPQAVLVSQFVENSQSDGIIVCGDFNDTPISYSYKKICRNLSDAYLQNGLGPGITYHENHFWFRIDYIMHSKNMDAYQFKIDKVKYSDHYPISTYLKFR